MCNITDGDEHASHCARHQEARLAPTTSCAAPGGAPGAPITSYTTPEGALGAPGHDVTGAPGAPEGAAHDVTSARSTSWCRARCGAAHDVAPCTMWRARPGCLLPHLASSL
eukprot:gene9098-biopygen2142